MVHERSVWLGSELESPGANGVGNEISVLECQVRMGSGSQVDGALHWQPRAVLDAGAERAGDLNKALNQCIGEIQRGQILQVISLYPGSRSEVSRWCLAAGHELLDVSEDGDEILFWIRKGS